MAVSLWYVFCRFGHCTQLGFDRPVARANVSSGRHMQNCLMPPVAMPFACFLGFGGLHIMSEVFTSLCVSMHIHYFAWKLLSAIYKFSFSHSFILLVGREETCVFSFGDLHLYCIFMFV